MAKFNFKYLFRLIIAYLKRFKGLIFIGVLIGISFFLILRFLLPRINFNKISRVAITGRYYTEELPVDILEKLSYGLTKVDQSGNVETGLASDWYSPDQGKTWTFTLKDNLEWHDEKILVSADLTFNFSDLEISYPDEKTITFKLNDTYSAFPTVVSKPIFKSGLLGAGDWKVDKLKVVNNFVSELTIINSENQKIIYKFYPTIERTKLAYKLGEVDSIENLIDPKPFDEWNTVDVETNVREDQVVTVFFNNQDKLTGQKSVRQALTYSIDKVSLSNNRAISPISPNSWSYNPLVKNYKYDIDRAKELVDDLPSEIKSDLNVKLVSSPQLLDTAEKIKQFWERIGISTQVQVSSIVPTDYQAFLVILDIPKDPDQYSLWHSTQMSSNISNFSNNRIDKLLEEGRVEMDYEARKKIYIDFQRFLLEEIPAAFLYHPMYYTIKRK